MVAEKFTELQKAVGKWQKYFIRILFKSEAPSYLDKYNNITDKSAILTNGIADMKPKRTSQILFGL